MMSNVTSDEVIIVPKAFNQACDWLKLVADLLNFSQSEVNVIKTCMLFALNWKVGG